MRPFFLYTTLHTFLKFWNFFLATIRAFLEEVLVAAQALRSLLDLFSELCLFVVRPKDVQVPLPARCPGVPAEHQVLLVLTEGQLVSLEQFVQPPRADGSNHLALRA